MRKSKQAYLESNWEMWTLRGEKLLKDLKSDLNLTERAIMRKKYWNKHPHFYFAVSVISLIFIFGHVKYFWYSNADQ